MIFCGHLQFIEMVLLIRFKPMDACFGNPVYGQGAVTPRVVRSPPLHDQPIGSGRILTVAPQRLFSYPSQRHCSHFHKTLFSEKPSLSLRGPVHSLRRRHFVVVHDFGDFHVAKA